MQGTKRTKKVVFIALLFLLLVFVGIALFYVLQPQLVTGGRDDLQQIVIVERYPGEGGGAEGAPRSIVTITDRETVHTIFDELRRTWPISETRGESFYTMATPRYELRLYYSDEVDEVRVWTAGAARWLGQPDRFTVSNRASAERIILFLDSVIADNE